GALCGLKHVLGHFTNSGQEPCFPATPSRHADDVQRRRQARNSPQPLYCWGLVAYNPKGLSGLNGRYTFVAITANLADKAQSLSRAMCNWHDEPAEVVYLQLAGYSSRLNTRYNSPLSPPV